MKLLNRSYTKVIEHHTKKGPSMVIMVMINSFDRTVGVRGKSNYTMARWSRDWVILMETSQVRLLISVWVAFSPSYMGGIVLLRQELAGPSALLMVYSLSLCGQETELISANMSDWSWDNFQPAKEDASNPHIKENQKRWTNSCSKKPKKPTAQHRFCQLMGNPINTGWFCPFVHYPSCSAVWHQNITDF
jgi:hypothetical protein